MDVVNSLKYFIYVDVYQFVNVPVMMCRYGRTCVTIYVLGLRWYMDGGCPGTDVSYINIPRGAKCYDLLSDNYLLRGNTWGSRFPLHFITRLVERILNEMYMRHCGYTSYHF